MTLAEDRAVQPYLTHGFRRVVVRHDESNFVYPDCTREVSPADPY